MTVAAPAGPHAPGFAEQVSTRVAFLACGLAVSAWAPLIPFAKTRLTLSDGQLGALLLCLGAGSVIGMPLAGALAGRLGCRAMTTAATILACAMLPLLASVNSAAAFAATLFFFGMAIGTWDVVMNIQAVIVERASGRAMMSGFHGLYSVGGVVGAGLVSLLISTGLPLLPTTIITAAITLLSVVCCFSALLPHGGDRDAPFFVLPHGRVLLLGVFCFVLFLAEGSVLDWSAVFLTTVRQMEKTHAGLGYVAFASAMTICRLLGDRIVHFVGPGRVVFFGGLCAASGFLLAALAPSPIAGIIGFALVGVGASNVVPVMFSAVGRQTAMPTNLAIAAMTTLGYSGILSGPAIVGLFANFFGLAIGLAIVALMLIAVAVLSRRVKF